MVDRTGPSEAGTESLARYRLQSKQVKVRSQVSIPGVGRVDLLVGNRSIIEVDGEEFHHSSEQFHRDRERDMEALRLGYLTLRLTYRHVVHDWTHRRRPSWRSYGAGTTSHLPRPGN